jgi:hypothetical protein
MVPAEAIGERLRRIEKEAPEALQRGRKLFLESGAPNNHGNDLATHEKSRLCSCYSLPRNKLTR